MDPARFDSHQSVRTILLQILSLPGLLSAATLVLGWPVLAAHLLGIPWWAGALALIPWWSLLARFAALVKLLACYFMLPLAVLGWIVLAGALRVAGLL